MQLETWINYREDDWEDDYYIGLSNYGRMRSYVNNPQGSIISGGTINGYTTLNVKLKNGKRRNFYLHKILAKAFLKPKENEKSVIHINHDKEDNRLVNLKWVTHKERYAHQKTSPLDIKRRTSGKRHYTKLSYAEAKILKKKLLDPNRRTRLRILAKQFGVSEMQLHRIKTGENWGDLEI
ncbi:HNH endonuclease [Leeuwenhoekiella sp. A16]|uniref:HNH endonuclease n=1 Tax=unclassified Leeuwenhoekiella TaxID=2615029 RepID=UPI003A7FE3C5|tara:strand:- start:147 stop:686 length:540 start_codon:yes stop_codon:yes gene_type:complete